MEREGREKRGRVKQRTEKAVVTRGETGKKGVGQKREEWGRGELD